jgi:hypothetical protein
MRINTVWQRNLLFAAYSRPVIWLKGLRKNMISLTITGVLAEVPTGSLQTVLSLFSYAECASSSFHRTERYGFVLGVAWTRAHTGQGHSGHSAEKPLLSVYLACVTSVQFMCRNCDKFRTIMLVGSLRTVSDYMRFEVLTRQILKRWSDVEAPTFTRKSAHKWRWGCQPYAPSYPCNKPWRPIGLWDVEAPTFDR